MPEGTMSELDAELFRCDGLPALWLLLLRALEKGKWPLELLLPGRRCDDAVAVEGGGRPELLPIPQPLSRGFVSAFGEALGSDRKIALGGISLSGQVNHSQLVVGLLGELSPLPFIMASFLPSGIVSCSSRHHSGNQPIGMLPTSTRQDS